MIEAHGLSDIGPVRNMNEDCFFSAQALRLFVVADGMGGHAAGEVASGSAVDTIRTSSAAPKRQDFPGPTASNRRSRSRPIASGPRPVSRTGGCSAKRSTTTNTSGWGRRSSARSFEGLAVAHVGDSRLYLWPRPARPAHARRLVGGDHARAQGKSDPAGPPPPIRHVLTNVLGAARARRSAPLEHDLRGGEMILLFSDGFHGVLADETLR